MSGSEARAYEVMVMLDESRRAAQFVQLITTQGEEVAIRRALMAVALRKLREGADVPPPSDSRWTGHVIFNETPEEARRIRALLDDPA